MRLLKTHSHTSNGLAMEPGTREEKQLKKTQILQLGKPPLENLPYTAGVAGGGAEKALRQTNHRKGTRARRTLADRKGNTAANTREKSQKKSLGGGFNQETTNTRNGRWPHLQPREGGKCLAEKNRTNTTHKEK